MEELSGSILGTQKYWQIYYQQEIENYKNYGDKGDIWFGKVLFSKIISWIVLNLKNLNEPILEIGCGNGHLLINLASKGFKNITGIDYANTAISLVQDLIETTKSKGIHVQVADILKDSIFEISKKFKLIVDKGTFDAICLNPDVDLSLLKSKYNKNIFNLLNDNGYLLIASCNWTKSELLDCFTPHHFTFVEEIPSAEITFGGKKGQSVTCLILKKVATQLAQSHKVKIQKKKKDG